MKKHGFWRIFGIYCLCLALIIGAGLFVLYRFLVAYEASRPETALTDFFSENGKQYCIDGLNKAISDGLGDFSVTDAPLSDFGIDESGQLGWRSSGVGTEDELHYDLKLGTSTIGTVTLTRAQSVGFGMSAWNVSDCSFAPGSAQSVTVEVPSGSRLTINAIEVMDAYLTGTRSADITPVHPFDRPPMYDVYTIDSHRGTMDIRAFDEDGTELEPESVTKSKITFSCTPKHAFSFWTTENATVTVNATDITGQFSQTVGTSLGDGATLVCYCFDSLYTKPDISVTVDGESVDAVSLSLGTCYIPGASVTVNETLSTFINDFIHAYVDFAANKDRAAKANFAVLQNYLVPGTDFYDTCRATIENIEWATTSGLTYHDTGCYDCIPLPDGSYLCHITYDVSYTFVTTKRDINADYVVHIEPYGNSYRVRAMLTEL